LAIGHYSLGTQQGGCMNDFVISETESQQVKVRLEGETRWVTQG